MLKTGASESRSSAKAEERGWAAQETGSLVSEAEVFGKKRKSVLDQVAAQAILQSFFEGGSEEFFNGRDE